MALEHEGTIESLLDDERVVTVIQLSTDTAVKTSPNGRCWHLDIMLLGSSRSSPEYVGFTYDPRIARVWERDTRIPHLEEPKLVRIIAEHYEEMMDVPNYRRFSNVLYAWIVKHHYGDDAVTNAN